MPDPKRSSYLKKNKKYCAKHEWLWPGNIDLGPQQITCPHKTQLSPQGQQELIAQPNSDNGLRTWIQVASKYHVLYLYIALVTQNILKGSYGNHETKSKI